MSDARLEQLAKCRSDLSYFARTCLKVRAKDGTLVPLTFNAAQLELHERLEQQKAEKGYVRAIVVKGRQQGISTYVAARFYWQASLRRGVNVYILSHEQSSADGLFSIVDRYHRNNPLAPRVGAANAKELVFDLLDSTYAVATAGTKAGGRGKTVSLFHGSEVAFWTNASDHFAASVQGVPLARNTEVILESTSAGAGGELYERWQLAESGRGDYIPVFLKWYKTPEYARDPEPGFELSDDANEGALSDQAYAETFGLSLRQMAWRKSKIEEMRNPALFQREYPADPSEAWTAPPGHEPFISPVLVLKARKRQKEAVGPLILGVDPASNGGDRFAIAARRGICVQWVRHRDRIDTLQGTEWIRSLIDELHPSRVNIDAGSIGAAIITNLKSLGPKYADVVRSVNFGGTAQAKLARPKVPGPKNRRAEMWQRSKEWLELPEEPSIPDDSELQADATGPKQKPTLTNDFLLESKDELRKRGIRSPDLWDAVVLTFASNEFFENYSQEKPKPQFGDLDTPRHSGVTPQFYDIEAGNGPGGWMI